MNAVITNADQNLISAIKAVLKLHPTAKIKVTKADETLHNISKEDEAKLRDIYERNKRGEVKFYTTEEIFESSNEVLRKYGANVWKLFMAKILNLL